MLHFRSNAQSKYLIIFISLSNCQIVSIDRMTMIYITNGHKLPVLSGLKRLCLQFVKFSHNCGPLVVPCVKFICRNLSNKGFFSIFVCYSLMQNQTIHRVTIIAIQNRYMLMIRDKDKGTSYLSVPT